MHSTCQNSEGTPLLAPGGRCGLNHLKENFNSALFRNSPRPEAGPSFFLKTGNQPEKLTREENVDFSNNAIALFNSALMSL
jgi:hypothetical protein